MTGSGTTLARRIDTAVLRYSRVWEDHRLLEEALSVTPESDVLCIASGGCNVLNLLLRGPASVTAVDISTSQLALVALEIAAVRSLSAPDMRRLLGVQRASAAERTALYEQVRPRLDRATLRWCDGQDWMAEGLAFAGRLERYLHRFSLTTLRGFVGIDEVQVFLAMSDLDDQRAWFDRHIDTDAVRAAFFTAFSPDAIATEGRDPEQFRYVDETSLGSGITEWFWRRFRWVCTHLPVADNPYLHAFLLGPDATVWTPGFTDGGHAQLQELVDRVRLHHGEAVELCAQRPAGTFSEAGLSDIFEYVSAAEARHAFAVLGERMRPGGRLAYWQLLVDRPLLAGDRRLEDLDELSDKLWEHDRSWFYRAFQVAQVRPASAAHPPRIPARGHYGEEARRERLAWVAEATGADVQALEETSLDGSLLKGNIENFVGGVEVPVGLVGPLLFAGRHVHGLVTAPFATTEGALVASATRGALAVSLAGGVTTRVVRERMTRAPLWLFDDVDTAMDFTGWLQEHLDDIRAALAEVSGHARLVELDPVVMGTDVHVRFVYETAEAAGQNMTTACTARACSWINATRTRRGLAVGKTFIDGNMSGDKKVDRLNLIEGRGTRVLATCHLDRGTLDEVLKVSPEAMERLYGACVAGSLHTGMVGSTINVANTVAAIFTATGQDIASVHESSVGVLTLRAAGDGLDATLVLPALIVGTVGGGTHLPAQRACLRMLGCEGPTSSARLAEIVAGFALALDLSTLAAVAGGQFADAHERLGRHRPVEWFTLADLTPALFTPMVARHADDPSVTVTDVAVLDDPLGSSIIVELVSRIVTGKFVGLVPMRLRYRRDQQPGDGHGAAEQTLDVLVKSKPLDREVCFMVAQTAAACGGAVAAEYARWELDTGFTHTHLKELALAAHPDPRLRALMPAVYGVHRDDAREAYVIVMEMLREGQHGIELLDTVEDVSGWQAAHLDTAVRDVAQAHAVWLDRVPELRAEPWLGPIPDAPMMTAMAPLWTALAEHGHREFPELIGDGELAVCRRLVAGAAERWRSLEDQPRTLVHNDFNPRNLCFRADAASPTGYRLVAYDWELATVHVPQYDLAELLSFTLTGPPDLPVVAGLVDRHRRHLEEASGRSLDADAWRYGFRLALEDFIMRRLALYVMAHTSREYPFLSRVAGTAFALLELTTAAWPAPLDAGARP